MKEHLASETLSTTSFSRNACSSLAAPSNPSGLLCRFIRRSVWFCLSDSARTMQAPSSRPLLLRSICSSTLFVRSMRAKCEPPSLCSAHSDTSSDLTETFENIPFAIDLAPATPIKFHSMLSSSSVMFSTSIAPRATAPFSVKKQCLRVSVVMLVFFSTAAEIMLTPASPRLLLLRSTLISFGWKRPYRSSGCIMGASSRTAVRSEIPQSLRLMCVTFEPLSA
mmetsp:Transcript_26047/g.85632  ORF Transcript_26047/g.85632 Transcript_26047/m.85632 type:complete len:223 (+) Transcript_26047:2948-3616(+)